MPDPPPDPDEPANYPPNPEDDLFRGSGVDGGTTRILTRLLRASPCLDLDDRAGGQHALRRRICFALDLIFRLVVWAVLLAVIAAVAWKTLAPLPDLWADSGSN